MRVACLRVCCMHTRAGRKVCDGEEVAGTMMLGGTYDTEAGAEASAEAGAEASAPKATPAAGKG